MTVNIKRKRIIWILIIVALALTTIYYLSTSMIFLPKGNKIQTIISPNNDYIMNAYFIDGGQLSANAVRVEIVYNNGKKVKNIYWSYSEDKASMKWLNNETVEINGIKLNIHKDHYNK